jgi:hypothetical protein
MTRLPIKTTSKSLQIQDAASNCPSRNSKQPLLVTAIPSPFCSPCEVSCVSNWHRGSGDSLVSQFLLEDDPQCTSAICRTFFKLEHLRGPHLSGTIRQQQQQQSSL